MSVWANFDFLFIISLTRSYIYTSNKYMKHHVEEPAQITQRIGILYIQERITLNDITELCSMRNM